MSCKSDAATGEVKRSEEIKLLSSRKATVQPEATLFFFFIPPLLQDRSAEDSLIRFFTLLAQLRACEKLVNDRGSQGVWRASASGQGSLHSALPLIHPLKFFYPIQPSQCQSSATFPARAEEKLLAGL